MRKLLILIAVILILVLAVPLQAASPDDPPGLERAKEVKERHTKGLLAVPGVVGVAVGTTGEDRAAVAVYTESAGVRGLPASLEGVPVVVHVSGKIVALPKPPSPPPGPTPRDRWPRPVPIGVSTGHPAITAGTIGARVKDGAGNVYALSNNHVYADENAASIGDPVIQPGTYDGGTSPADNIGTLYAFKTINFTGGDNVIDAAIALSSLANLGKATPPGGYGTPKSATTAASFKMKVKKFGRTTSQTKGQVAAIQGTFNVGYDAGVARFVNQIVISPGTFSAGGDSGSLIVTDSKNSAADRIPVGLLFAGSPSYTIANPINAVLAEFGVSIDGE